MQTVDAARVFSEELLDRPASKVRELEAKDRDLLAVAFCLAAGFDDEHAPLTWDGYHAKVEPELRHLCQTRPVRSVYLCGPVGTGKTGLLAAMSKTRFLDYCDKAGILAHQAVSALSHHFLFVRHTELIEYMHDYNEESERSPLETFEYACGVRYLLIDDLGTGYEDRGGFHLARLEELVDFRRNHRLPTWITSNIAAKDLSRANGWERISSRMATKDWLQPFNITGEDRRRV